MSGLSEASTPAQDAAPPSIDTQQLHGQHNNNQDLANELHQPQQPLSGSSPADGGRKPKAPSVRRACAACHAGKTRCSEVLPCQSCLKRGLGPSCSYPEPDADNHQNQSTPPQVPPFAAAIAYPPPMQGLPPPQYYDYNNTFPANPAPSTSTFRPSKRPRPLTEEETAAITRNFTRGDFFVGSSAPVRIDPRLPVRLTLAEGDQVHFSIGEAIV